MEFPLVIIVFIVLLFECLFVCILLYLSCSVVIKILFIRHFEMISSMSEKTIMIAVHGCSVGLGVASILSKLVIKVKIKRYSFTHNTSDY